MAETEDLGVEMSNKDNGLKHSFWVRFGSSTILMTITVLSMIFGGYVLFGILLIVIGGLNAFFPALTAGFRAFWQSWQYKDSAPTDAALLVTRIGGIFVLLVGIALILYGVIRV